MDAGGAGPHRRRPCRAAAAETIRSPSGESRSGGTASVGSRLEIGMAGQEALDLSTILLGLQRASRVNQQPARRDDGRGAVEQLGLEPLQRSQRLRRHPPAGVGMASEGAGPQAGCVEQHDLRLPERRPSGIGHKTCSRPLPARRMFSASRLARERLILTGHDEFRPATQARWSCRRGPRRRRRRRLPAGGRRTAPSRAWAGSCTMKSPSRNPGSSEGRVRSVTNPAP